MFSARFIVDRSALLCLSPDIFFGTMSKRKILEVTEVKPLTKKKKLKTNSHTRKNREKKMMRNFQIRNLAISRRNGRMITSGYGTKKTQCFLRMLCHFCQLAKKKNPFGGNKGCTNLKVQLFCPLLLPAGTCINFVPLQGPQRDKLSPEAIKLAQTLKKVCEY